MTCTNAHAYNHLLQATHPESLAQLDKTHSPVLNYLISFNDPGIVKETLQKNPALSELTNNQGESFLHRPNGTGNQ